MQARARFLVIVQALLLFGLKSSSQDSPILIDNFDGPEKLRNWTFSNGAEFQGASGTLSLGQGHEGNGAVLAYRFVCSDAAHCGHYVAAIWKAPHPLPVSPGAALSLWVTLPVDVRLTVRVTDETGQTLQFHPNSPTLEHPSSGEWEPVVVPITSQASETWGGAHNGRIQGRVSAIALLADSRFLQPARGQMAFDDLRLIGTGDSTLQMDSSLTAVAPAPDPGGVLRNRFGVTIHSLKDDRGLDIAKAAGFSFVRADLPWAKLEDADVYHFEPFDELMHSLEERNLGVVWVLDYGHPNHGGESPKSDDDFNAYANYAAAVVSHFRGQNARFEVWNEPNSKQFLPDPNVYPRLLRSALDRIRRNDADALVSTGGTAGFDLAFLTSVLESGSADKASAIAVHPYRDSGPETSGPDFLLLRHLIQRVGRLNLPLWETEWGYSSAGNGMSSLGNDGHNDIARNRQAVLTVRECLTLWALGVPIAVLYDLRDDGSNPHNREQNFGLLDQDNNTKPAMEAFRTLMRVSVDHTYSGLIRDVPYGTHALRLDGANDIAFIIWAENAALNSRIRFLPDQLMSAKDLFGHPIGVQGDQLLLKEDMGPVYVQLKRR
jgi:glycosyltransferase involved in cell wall biosynthesis